MASANDISIGNVLKHKGGYWIVTKREHVKPGKGGAFVQVEMKGFPSGGKINERFRASENIEKAYLEDVSYQYQYMDGDNLALMDMETYEQVMLPKEMVGEALPFLQDEMMVKVQKCEGKPVTITLPEQVILDVAETEPVVKGQTAASSFKPAVLSNGVRVMVPPFVNSDDKIVVRTSDSTYVERAK